MSRYVCDTCYNEPCNCEPIIFPPVQSRIIGTILTPKKKAENDSLLAAKDTRIATLERELAEARRDGERYNELYKMAYIMHGRDIVITMPLPMEADWDGTTCIWNQGVFNSAIAAMKGAANDPRT